MIEIVDSLSCISCIDNEKILWDGENIIKWDLLIVDKDLGLWGVTNNDFGLECLQIEDEGNVFSKSIVEAPFV